MPWKNFIQSYRQEFPLHGADIAYKSMVQEDGIDFGRLDEKTKSHYPNHFKSPDLQKLIRQHSNLQVLCKDLINANQAVTEQFSLSSYAENDENLSVTNGVDRNPDCQFADGKMLLDQFLSPNRLNLLRTS